MKFSILQKRILTICFLVIFSTCTYAMIGVKKESQILVKANAMPIANKVIVIDSGHRNSR